MHISHSGLVQYCYVTILNFLISRMKVWVGIEPAAFYRTCMLTLLSPIVICIKSTSNEKNIEKQLFNLILSYFPFSFTILTLRVCTNKRDNVWIEISRKNNFLPFGSIRVKSGYHGLFYRKRMTLNSYLPQYQLCDLGTEPW